MPFSSPSSRAKCNLSTGKGYHGCMKLMKLQREKEYIIGKKKGASHCHELVANGTEAGDVSNSWNNY